MESKTIPVEPLRPGGFRKPISVRQFIIEHLQTAGEDHPSAMHQAYKAALAEIPLLRSRRGKRYKACTYYSFTRALNAMRLEGIIKQSRTEISDSIHTAHWETKPLRNYYVLVERGT